MNRLRSSCSAPSGRSRAGRSSGARPLGQEESGDDDAFRISLAGAQEKTALLWHKGAWHRPTGATPTTHILKLPIGVSPQGIDLSTSVENEWLCAQIVREYGIPVAPCRIETFGERKTLVVERFDRQLAADGAWWLRLPQEDFCQSTATPPALKYENDGGPGIRTKASSRRSSACPVSGSRKIDWNHSSPVDFIGVLAGLDYAQGQTQCDASSFIPQIEGGEARRRRRQTSKISSTPLVSIRPWLNFNRF